MEVAIILGVAAQIKLDLELLAEKHCWLMFSQLAFYERTSEDCKQLEEIWSKCKQVQRLAICSKDFRKLMRLKQTKKDWEGVLSSRMWDLWDDNTNFRSIVVDYDLPPLEKRYFSYCSMFPRDYTIDRDKQEEMWTPQVYLRGRENPERWWRLF